MQLITLSNGLRVAAVHTPRTAVAAVNLLYDVGARDESPRLTGLAHLFEHLMFGGSENIADFDAEMERAGATTNAWTSNDFTNFYDLVPVQNLEIALRAEADRMMAMTLTEEALETQKKVVIEEFKQTTLTLPYGTLMQEFRKEAFRRHPYRWETIGRTPAHIEKVTLDEAKEFFFRHYAPANAILTVAGATPPDEVFRMAEKWFGNIQPSGRKPRNLPQEGVQRKPRVKPVYAAGPAPHILIGYQMGGYGSEYYRSADLLTDILSLGASSRTVRELMLGTGLFSKIDSSIMGSEDPGMLLFSARLVGSDAASVGHALNVMESFMENVADKGVTHRETLRAKNQFESSQVFNTVSNQAKAFATAIDIFHGQTPQGKLEEVKSLTPEAITAAARHILNPQRSTTLLYLPENESR